PSWADRQHNAAHDSHAEHADGELRHAPDALSPGRDVQCRPDRAGVERVREAHRERHTNPSQHRFPSPSAPQSKPAYWPYPCPRIARMSVRREGGCACAAVRYRLTSDPMFVHCCHCLNCQRQTGSAFVINLLIEADHVEILGETPRPVDVPRDDGDAQRIFRCQHRQVAVFSEYGRRELRYIRAGTLDDPIAITPDVHIYTRSKVDWGTLPPATP